MLFAREAASTGVFRGIVRPMNIAVRPASVYEDVRTLVGPKSPGANVCWCLSYRIPAKLNKELRGPARGEYVAGLCRAEPPPGVIAYEGGEPIGWAAVAPRSVTSFARSRSIPHVDALPVWSLWCIRVRPGHRGKGVSHALIAGAVAFARDRGAPAIEAYPLDSGGDTVDLTMAYAGIRKNFERAGFSHAADTTSVLAGHPRVLMRLDLRG
ncbi:GNAT family N-acetyltransferase [Streptomyces californicus]